MHCCKGCIAGTDIALQMALLAGESRAHLLSKEVRQTWNGTEPALQLLKLPLATAEPLPPYSDRPEYLHPVHCRLCLSSYLGEASTAERQELANASAGTADGRDDASGGCSGT